MSRTAAVGAIVGSLLVGGSVSSGEPAVQRSAPDEGRALFLTYCSSCHGRDGRGDGPVAPSLKVPPQDLTKFAQRNGGSFPLDLTRRIVDGRDPRARTHGPVGMPVWGDAFVKREGLSEGEARSRIEAIVRYLDSIQERSGQ
jgi:mono/diheme cytochrome c family protein